MRVLVTGAEGFIGSYLTPELYRGGHDVVPVDRAEGDLSSHLALEWMIQTCRPDVVVHLAAKYGRLKGEVDPAYTVEQNAVVTTRVARACGAMGVRLVYVSSSEAYGDRGNAGIREDSLYDGLPHNIYGLSKRWGEEVAHLYAPDRLLILRLNMPYGPGQEGGWGSCALIQFLERAAASEPIVVHRGAERSWCYAQDTVRAMRYAIERDAGGVFNVGRDDDPRLMSEVAQIACGLAGASTSLIRVVDPPVRQTVVKRLDVSRIRGLGWAPEVGLEDGMRRTLAAMGEAKAA